ncbi:signal peptidase I [Halobacteriales archaeon QS_1_68_17]|nr:MAG: signal peptidase I [Halobacteriales archaeon QS_1_68_17]
MLRRTLGTVATVGLVVLVGGLLVGQLLGQPMVLGYVSSDSMEPTLSEGDGFVAIPAYLAGDPDPGDVVVFDAKELNDGELTTHRIVDRTEDGYVTKGDANPFTDQDGGEPPVTDSQIKAHALQVNGDVVGIPYVGTLISVVRGVLAAPFAFLGVERAGTVLIGLGVALFVLAGAAGRETRPTNRSRDRRHVLRAWVLVLAAAVLVTGAATAAMLVPQQVHQVPVISTDEPTSDPLVGAPETTTRISAEFHNSGVIPVLVILEPVGSGVSVDPDRTIIGHDERVEATFVMPVPEETGEYQRYVRESRYLLVLPEGIILWLHRIHPLVALLAVDAVVALFVVSASVLFFGTGYLRIRSGPDHVSLRERLRRRLRG